MYTCMYINVVLMCLCQCFKKTIKVSATFNSDGQVIRSLTLDTISNAIQTPIETSIETLTMTR